MDSLSAQLLTDPYTALHHASVQAVADAAGDLRAATLDALAHSPAPGHDTGTTEGRKAVAELLGEHLAPLVSRYAHAITGVQTLRALLNAGTLEFSPDGTVKRMSALLEKLADVKADDDEGVDELAGEARALLADFRDAEPAGIVEADAAAQSVEALPEPTPHFTATRRDGEKHSATVPRSIGRGELQAVLTAARSYDGYTWTIERGGDGDETVIGRLEADGRYRHADEIERAEATEAFEADAAVVAGDEAITVAVDAPNDPTKKDAYEALDPLSPEDAAAVRAAAPVDATEERGRTVTKAPAYPSPFYQVHRAGTGTDRLTPHCTTRTYDSALSYCRAQSGTPWEIVQAVEGKGLVTVARIAADGTLEEIGELLNQAAAAALEAPLEPARAAAAELAADGRPVVFDDDGEPAQIWFTVHHKEDPAQATYCQTAHYAIALEYCKGCPGQPWEIRQFVLGINAGGVLVTTVDEAGDVTEVGERGAS